MGYEMNKHHFSIWLLYVSRLPGKEKLLFSIKGRNFFCRPGRPKGIQVSRFLGHPTNNLHSWSQGPNISLSKPLSWHKIPIKVMHSVLFLTLFSLKLALIFSTICPAAKRNGGLFKCVNRDFLMFPMGPQYQADWLGFFILFLQAF